jgi:zinc/manganese transport system permease protein
VIAGIPGPLTYPFMVNALRAGAVVAVVAGALGWFMVLRRQTFAGHTLSLVGFPGAAGATLLGVSAALGYFTFCIVAAAIFAAIPRRRSSRAFSEESAVIGSVQSLMLASGFLFVSLYAGNLNGLNALLFGSFLGISNAQVLVLLAVGVPALLALAAIARPLLFESLDAEVAAAAGVRVRIVAAMFLVLLGAAVAEASQITGSLLVFALLVLPPAAAQALTLRPVAGVLLSMAIGVAVTWGGLVMAYYLPYPAGTFITSLSFGVYLVARAVKSARERRTGEVVVPGMLAPEAA